MLSRRVLLCATELGSKMVANRYTAVLSKITLLVALRPGWIGASQQRPRHGSTGLLPPPALSERCHRSLARRRIAVRRPRSGQPPLPTVLNNSQALTQGNRSFRPAFAGGPIGS